MVVVLLGCVGLTAGVTLGTLYPSSVISSFTAVNTTCLSDWSHGHRPVTIGLGRMPDIGCPSFPSRLIHRGVPMGGYVLLGLLAGLSAALGFLVPPRSRLTRM
jgi:hypothetical protein